MYSKIKSKVKALSLYKITQCLFKILNFCRKAHRCESGFSEKHEIRAPRVTTASLEDCSKGPYQNNVIMGEGRGLADDNNMMMRRGGRGRGLTDDDIAMIFLMVVNRWFFCTSWVGFPDFETIDFPNKIIFSKNMF